MPGRRTTQRRSRSGGEGVTDRRAELLKSDIDLGFTFVAVALTSYTAGNTGLARQAAKDAQKKLRAAQKQLVHVEREQRRTATDRLQKLEQVLITIEKQDPGVFSSHPSSAKSVRQEDLADIIPGSQGRKNGHIVPPSGDDDDS
jgi:hypothetical protein